MPLCGSYKLGEALSAGGGKDIFLAPIMVIDFYAGTLPEIVSD